MSDIEITYDGALLAYDVPPTKISVPQRAELGGISMGSLGIEDPAAALALVGHRPIYVEEADCSQPRLFTGWVAERNIGRSVEQSQFVGSSARIHDTTIVDLNACFGFRIITGADGNRPAETIDARVAWILASAYLTGLVDDTGKIASRGGDALEPTDYRGQYPADVMSDVAGFTNEAANWFAFWDPAPATGVARPGLFFANVDATLNVSTISISNVLADIDNVTCFAPSQEARLERTPETVYSDVILDYGSGGSVYRTLASTETAHIKRGTTISRPRTGRSATAIIQADNWLVCHANEVDRLTPTIHVPSSVVGLLWAGQQMQVKMSHLPGYTGWATMRIVASNPRPVDDLALWYDVDLELVAARVAPAAGACSTASMEFIADDLTTSANGDWDTAYSPKTTPVSAPVVNPSLLLAILNLENTGDYLGYNLVVASPWTMLDGNLQPTDSYNRTLAGIAYLPYTGSAIPDVSFGWSGSYVRNGASIVTSVAIHTSATSEVQHVGIVNTSVAYPVHLPSAPTEGNLLLMVCLGGTPSPPPGDWVTVHEIDPARDWHEFGTIGVYMRCVGAGESQDVATNLRTAETHWNYLSEWAVSGVTTTGGTIPPPPGTTTVATTDPTATDDSDHGYLVGVPWVNTATGEAFVLVDNTVGAAVWTPTTTGGGGSPNLDGGLATSTYGGIAALDAGGA